MLRERGVEAGEPAVDAAKHLLLDVGQVAPRDAELHQSAANERAVFANDGGECGFRCGSHPSLHDGESGLASPCKWGFRGRFISKSTQVWRYDPRYGSDHPPRGRAKNARSGLTRGDSSCKQLRAPSVRPIRLRQ